jgi:hypothetical protein
MEPRPTIRSLAPGAVPRVLAAVRGCPDRGPVLPHHRQPECGCAELTECRASRGASGAVTLEECVRCRYEALGLGPSPTADDD